MSTELDGVHDKAIRWKILAELRKSAKLFAKSSPEQIYFYPVCASQTTKSLAINDIDPEIRYTTSSAGSSDRYANVFPRPRELQRSKQLFDMFSA